MKRRNVPYTKYQFSPRTCTLPALVPLPTQHDCSCFFSCLCTCSRVASTGRTRCAISPRNSTTPAWNALSKRDRLRWKPCGSDFQILVAGRGRTSPIAVVTNYFKSEKWNLCFFSNTVWSYRFTCLCLYENVALLWASLRRVTVISQGP